MLTKEQLIEAQKIFAAKAGSTKSEKKSEAARENGKLGGRPRKNVKSERSRTSVSK